MAEVDSRIGVDDKKDGIGIILPRGLAIAGALRATHSCLVFRGSISDG